MAAPVYTTDLTPVIEEMPSTTGWTALGGGPAALVAPETDYFIQGANCISKAAWTNATKGMIYNNGSGITVPSDGAVLLWLYYSATNSLDTRVNGGIQALIGSGTGDFKQWYISGKDLLLLDVWRPYAVDPTVAADATTGAPTSTLQYFGGQAKLPSTAGPTKGNPWAIDAIRYGRCTLSACAGESASPATFVGIEATSNASANRWGLMEFVNGAYFTQGFLSLGTATCAVDFRDSNRIVFFRDTVRTSAAFNRIEVRDPSSNVEWTNISMFALGTTSKGTFVSTAGAVKLVDCQFTDMNTFTFLSSGSVQGCTFRRCDQIIAPGTDLTNSIVDAYPGAANTSALVWDVNTDPDGKLDNMEFVRGTNAHHAIELGTTSPLTMTLRGITFTGFNTANGQNDSVLHIKRTSGEVTINTVNTVGVVSYRTEGATVNIVINPVTLSIHVQDSATSSAISGARVLAKAASGGPKPYQVSVSIARTGGTATVTHTSHGLATNDFVYIEGCNEGEYNGIFQITNTGANTYTYTVSGAPATPATGAPLATFTMVSGITDGGGDISAVKSYASNQPFSGWVRKASVSPFYKTGPFSGTINSSTGANVTVQMVEET